MKWADLFGTVLDYFRIGYEGPRLKNDGSGGLQVRDAADSADANVTADELNLSGEQLVINSDAAESTDDWSVTIQRDTANMTANVTLTLPPDDGSPGDVLHTDGTGALYFDDVVGGSGGMKVDTTALAFGSASPVSMFNLGEDDVVDKIKIIIDTSFDGTDPQLSIGIAGTTSKYAAATLIDLKQPAGTVIEINPGLEAPGSIEALIATYVADGSSAGAARINVFYGEPS